MFEPNMDEYLDEEIEYIKLCFDRICRAWEKTVRPLLTLSLSPATLLQRVYPAS